ncbi:acetyl-CoA C-acetyltransferase [Mycobacterium koreense]|uniref:Acetyl-CoA acetyltransferase n=1 Tax=Mycolicibacillus koreensis TaxID=1069220 RepID=A0A7I7S7T7_9MYCO|nr:acetyl-CoA C-acetyltransferase [Mycolicibacillus koreensis]MCV7250030.1 acetyl-CoA C-acetyltransferase [Mycolicibacillus koreensis]ODR04939.1 acetyl-CoA acetyltransferase [Mycolicibacillus koreensis]OSC31778.1 acetyl-CoA acetyltransferase [Mycolicibacillus koreensis]BBY52763.1 acetyl-CoA acetyltransferase [Mycolicibacillus koreensis]
MIDDSNTAYIFDAIRTPRGKGRPSGSLHIAKPISLVVGLISELRNRHPDLAPEAIEDIVLGIVSPRDEQGSVLPRIAALAAGLPVTVGGLQVNRFCGSGLEAVNIAAQKVQSGSESLVLAGGVESMSRVAMGSDGGAWFEDPATSIATGYVPQGIGADLIATIEGFDRESVDAYAIRSQRLAAAAWSGGYFAKSVVPVKDEHGFTLLDRDEHLRPEATLGSLAKLEPAFARLGADGFDAVALSRYHWVDRIDHVHHAGNSSGIVDGASLVVIGNKDAGTRCGLTPRARISATATSGADPTIMLTGPTPATQKLLAKAGLRADQIDLFEINEAFAAVVLKYIKDLDLPENKVNVNGGAIAMGHPLGATGAMLVGTIVDELERRDAHRAVVTLCIGAGMGVATLIERV